jgi:ABC-type spermidine/putrescine transport system permease subunit I
VENSAATAVDLMTKLLYLGIDCQYYTDYYLQRISASSLHQDDTVIAISYSGQSKDVVDTVKIAKKAGAKVVVITNFGQTLLEKSGVINGILTALHLPNQNLINTPGAIILGMVYNFLPFMVLPIYNVLCKIDDNTINAARDLGASFTQTLLWVWFPLSVPGIISGITMVFVPSLTTFVISNLLGGSKILLIGNVIEQEFTKGSNWNLGSGLSLVLMVFILISMALIAKYDKNGEGSTF